MSLRVPKFKCSFVRKKEINVSASSTTQPQANSLSIDT